MILACGSAATDGGKKGKPTLRYILKMADA
jgi:hypothetical protein